MSVHNVSFQGYNIETTVTADGAEVDAWICKLHRRYHRREILVGLDCEWKPSYTTGVTNKAAILQLCVDTECLIIQLRHLNYIPQSLREFLSNPDGRFVGVAVHRDLAKIKEEYGSNYSYAIDVRGVTLRRWPRMFDHEPGLGEIAFEVVGLSMPKPQHVRLSNWEERWLDWDQIQYACIDAFGSFKIGSWLINGV